ncbi:hypothetical protein T35B1_12412 [Salinisphaera shabanensis T35B1]
MRDPSSVDKASPLLAPRRARFVYTDHQSGRSAALAKGDSPSSLAYRHEARVKIVYIGHVFGAIISPVHPCFVRSVL